jgi:hypothetical protein
LVWLQRQEEVMRVRVSPLAAGIGLCAVLMGLPACTKMDAAYAKTGDEAEIAELLITMVKIGRTIVSEHQALINDATKGNKGFTDNAVGRMIMERFMAETRIDPSNPAGYPHSEILLAMLQS